MAKLGFRTTRSGLRPHQTVLLLASGVALIEFLAPPFHLFFLPLVYLNTHLHEMSHAVVCMLTGGDVKYINVFVDGSGVTPIAGGNTFLEASAGYLGATIIGGAIIFYGRTPEKARIVFGVLAAALGLSMVFWVRGDAVGWMAGLFWCLSLGAASWFLRGTWALFLCQLIGIEQCVNSITSVFQLLKISMVTDVNSDALIMQHVTYIPAPVWAATWTIFSFLVLLLMIRKAWNLQGPG